MHQTILVFNLDRVDSLIVVRVDRSFFNTASIYFYLAPYKFYI